MAEYTQTQGTTLDLSELAGYQQTQGGTLDIALLQANQPENLTIDHVALGEVDLSWDDGGDSEEFRVFRDGTHVATTSNTSYTDGGLDPDTAYDWEVSAVIGDSESDRTDPVSATTGGPASGLTVSAGDRDADLEWSNASGDIQDVHVERSDGSGYSRVASPGVTGSYTDSGLVDGRTYSYRVVLEYRDAEANPSGTESDRTDLPAPTLSNATGGDRVVDLSFAAEDNNPDGDLEIRRDGGAVTTVGVEETAYTDTGADVDGREYSYILERDTSDVTAESGTETATTDVPAPEITALSSDSLREVIAELSIPDNNPDGDLEIRRDEAAITTLTDLEATSYTDTGGVLDGYEHEYVLERDTTDATVESGLASVVAYLPDVTGLSLDGTPTTELGVEWDDVLNNGQFRLEFREDDPDGVEGSGVWGEGLYGEGLYSPHPAYRLETTVGHDATPEHTIADVLDGDQFSVRIRTETDHATGEWLAGEELTKLYSPDAPTFGSADATELTVTWTNNSIFEGSNQVYRRRLYPDATGRWRLVGTAAPDATEFTDDTVTPDTEYEYYVHAQTQWIGTDSDTSDAVATEDIGLSHRAVPPRGWHAEIERPDGTIVTPAILSEGTQFQPALNEQPSATINAPRDEAYLLEQYEGAPMHLYKDGSRLAVDELEDIVIETDRDELVGMGATALEQDISVDVSERPAHELAEELIEEHTDMVPTVDAPEDTIVEDAPIASAIGGEELRDVFEGAVDPTDPVIIDDQYILLAESCFFFEGEDYSGETMPSGDLSIEESEDYSGGESVFFHGPEGTYLEWEFETEYTMPADHVAIGARRAGPFSGMPILRYEVDGAEVGVEAPESGDPAWTEEAAVGLDDDLEPGGHTLRAYIDSDGDGDTDYELDCLAVYDNRYEYTFDDDVEVQPDDDHTIEGPEPYPDEHAIESDEILAAVAVDTARVETSIEIPGDYPDGEEPAALQVRFGTGAWLPDDGSEDNTNSIEVTNPGDLSTRLFLRVTLRRYGSFTTSPTEGGLTQWLESMEIEGDLDTTPLAINKSPEGDLGDVLTEIAEDADAVWEAWQDGDQTRFEWTYPGVRETRRADAISDYTVTKHTQRTLRCKVKGANSPVRGETFTASIGETVALEETDIARGKETVRAATDDTRLRSGFDYELDAIAGEITMLDSNRIDGGGEFEIDYDYAVSGVWEHDDYDGDLRTARTETIPNVRSSRGAEQAAQIIVQENSVPRWEVDFTIAYEDAQDLRLTDTLDLEDVPGEAEVIYNINNESSESGLQGRLGNRSSVDETVSQIQSTLSSAADLV